MQHAVPVRERYAVLGNVRRVLLGVERGAQRVVEASPSAAGAFFWKCARSDSAVDGASVPPGDPLDIARTQHLIDTVYTLRRFVACRNEPTRQGW